MTVFEFTALPTELPISGKIGDCFLTEKLAEQKMTKKAGQEVTYYQIVKATKNSFEYTMKFTILTD